MTELSTGDRGRNILAALAEGVFLIGAEKAAIEKGTNIVRVGTKLFGDRPPS